VQLVTGLGEPTGQGRAFRPPQLMGKLRSVQGKGKAQLQDDLTERIYAAYYALQRTGVRNVRRDCESFEPRGPDDTNQTGHR
jgi:hypothetical protein